MGVQIAKMEEIKFKELAGVIKILNDSGKLDNKIPTVSKTKEDLVASFVAAVQAIPDDAEGNWTGPDAAALYYQKITIPEAVAEKAKKDKPAPKAKAGKEPKAPVEKKDVYTRIASIVDTIKANGNKVTENLAKEADALYVEKSGKNTNEKESKWAQGMVVKSLEAWGGLIS